MRIAVLGDAHGNLDALQAVLRDLRKRRVDAIWNLGDLVGYGPHPEEVVQRMRKGATLAIAGNFDLKVLGADPRDPGTRGTPLGKWIGPVWARENLSRTSLRYLSSLPRERRLTIEGHRVLLTHGSPASNTERLEPGTPPERLAELAKMAHAEIVVCSHSHMPFLRTADGVTFVNSGGAGRSDDGDPRASYAVLDVAKNRVRVTHHRVAYPVEAAVDALQRRGLPAALGRMLLEATTLEGVLANPKGHLPGSTAAHARDLENVLALARSCRYEVGHAHQVTRLALDLFDQLQPLHGLDKGARRWVLYAGLLHDIGWLEGAKGHHKTSQRIIESSHALPFAKRERRILACVARYHRGALPKKRHLPYAELSEADRATVSKLAALLRVADGLDRTHASVVARLSAKISPRRVQILCEARTAAEEERRFALKKGDLFRDVFERDLAITCSRR
ncbi:MAG TPA: metallophosphoesterase family protein [Thermoplasmata archaeon]|nr:metallophosphoesterase family protein [Thermoplasmata archaeon]